MSVRPIDTSKLGPIRAMPAKPDDWRLPYRSMDAGGSPSSAGQVGWTWLEAIAKAEHMRSPTGLELDNQRLGADGGTMVLYRGTKLLAAAMVFRDPMNFAVLLRWKAESVA